MRNNHLFRVLATFLVVTILATNLVISASAYTDTATFTVENKTANVGDTINVAVNLNVDAYISGIGFSVIYDSTRLSYVSNSATCGISEVANPSIFFQSTLSKVNFAWEADNAVIFSAGNILNLQFRILSNAPVGAAFVKVEPTSTSLYRATFENGQIKWYNITATTIAGGITVGQVIATVNDTITAISNIGTVTYTDACNNAILAAFGKYSTLSYSERQQVSNYQTLLDASETYDTLKRLAQQDALTAEITAYTTKHAQALSLNILTVTVANKDIVAAAKADFDKLSLLAQADLNNKKGLLTVLTTQIAKLQKSDDAIKEAQKELERLTAEAAEIKSGFEVSYKVLLDLGSNDISIDQRTGVMQALLEIDSIELANPIAFDLLAPQKAKLEAFMARIEELEIQEDKNNAPNIVAKNNYIRNFGWVLSQTVDTITVDDEMDVKIAIEVGKLLALETRDLLKNEFSLLNTLLDKIVLLKANVVDDGKAPDQNTDGTIVDNNDGKNTPAVGTVTEKIVTKINNVIKNNNIVKFLNRNMGLTIWLLFGLLGASLIMFATLRFVYFRNKKLLNPSEKEVVL